MDPMLLVYGFYGDMADRVENCFVHGAGAALVGQAVIYVLTTAMKESGLVSLYD